MTEPANQFIEQSAQAATVYAENLLRHYSFELGGHSIAQLLTSWLSQYAATWVRLAIVEALYQGRYKAVSVEQILIFWQRRGQPFPHFNHEFERLVCNKFPRNLTPDLAAAPGKSGVTVPFRRPPVVEAPLPVSAVDRQGDAPSPGLEVASPSQPIADSSELSASLTEPPIPPSIATEVPPARSLSTVTNLLARLDHLKQTTRAFPAEDTPPSTATVTHLQVAARDRPHLLPMPATPSGRLQTRAAQLHQFPAAASPVLVPPAPKRSALHPQLVSEPTAQEPYQPLWIRDRDHPVPIHQFVPAPADFSAKLRAVAQPPPSPTVELEASHPDLAPPDCPPPPHPASAPDQEPDN